MATAQLKFLHFGRLQHAIKICYVLVVLCASALSEIVTGCHDVKDLVYSTISEL